MIQEYKITSLSKREYFYKILLVTFLIHLAILSMYFYFKEIREPRLMLGLLGGVIFGWILIFALPVILLYFNHFKHSKGLIFKHDTSNDSFVYKGLSNSLTFTLKDISKIELCMTSTAYEKRTDWLFYGKYSYCSIHTLEGKQVTISCLVCDKVENIFPKELIVKTGKFLPLISRIPSWS